MAKFIPSGYVFANSFNWTIANFWRIVWSRTDFGDDERSLKTAITNPMGGRWYPFTTILTDIL
ncbi:unnamed protein product [Sphenostylis stenocarpa]|uniref:Uncharacterized protein n=1 Tax=Sphenostylis stenocarpa TaxID=92480 RepID=A0AA87B6E4_9FABA|nr:unnamed protein product [Sphenostylis stenocarpa]